MAIGYGTSMWVGADGLRTGRYASGVTAVAQSLFRRFTTTRGTLRTRKSSRIYGLDLVGLVGSLDDTTEASLPSRLRVEALKDRRVRNLEVDVAKTIGEAGSVTFTVAMRVTLRDSGESFPLTLAVSDLTVELIGGWPE